MVSGEYQKTTCSASVSQAHAMREKKIAIFHPPFTVRISMSPLFLSPFLDFYVSDSTLIGKPANLWVSKLGNYPNRARKCPIILPLPNPPPSLPSGPREYSQRTTRGLGRPAMTTTTIPHRSPPRQTPRCPRSIASSPAVPAEFLAAGGIHGCWRNS